MKKRILFVDDEPKVLMGLRRMLRPMRAKWKMDFAGSGRQALEILAKQPSDVIVSDMRMPGMSGMELLNKVRKRYPQTVRIALSGQTDKEMSLRAAGSAHQYLSKPCGAETLKAALARACALSELLGENKLQRLVSRLRSLPSQPSLYLEIVEELQSPEVSMERVGRIISRDVSMTAKVLQLVNSAFFGLPQHVSSPSQATVLLGLETIRDLVLSIHVFSQFDRAKLEWLGLGTLWEHSVTVGAIAKAIAGAERTDEKTVDYAFTAGLLHDVGKLVLADNLPVKYHSALGLAARRGIELQAAERKVFGATHAQVGAYLLALWGLPDSVVETTAFHHSPGKYPSAKFAPVVAVHVANVLEHEAHPKERSGARPKIDSAYIAELGLDERLPEWRKICQEVIREGKGK